MRQLVLVRHRLANMLDGTGRAGDGDRGRRKHSELGVVGAKLGGRGSRGSCGVKVE